MSSLSISLFKWHYGLFQSFYGNIAILSLVINADTLSIYYLAGYGSCATTDKRVKHYIVWARADTYKVGY